jgi:carbon storage regulator
MLVLSRRCDTAIQIGPDIKVTVLSIRNRQVKLGIDAPTSVRVWRDGLCRDDPRLLEDDHENRNVGEPVQV